MPNYVGHSPWLEAAQMGRGLGQTLGAILFQVPKMRHDRQVAEQELALRERQISNQEAMIQPRLGAYAAQQRNYADQATYRTGQLARQSAKDVADLQLKQTDQKWDPIWARLKIEDANRHRELGGYPLLKLDVDQSGIPSIREEAQQEIAPPPVAQDPPGKLRSFLNTLMGKGPQAPQPIAPTNQISSELVNLANMFLGNSGNRVDSPIIPPQAPENPALSPLPSRGNFMSHSVPAVSGDKPPDNIHTFKLRHKVTGQYFWGDSEHANHPDYMVEQ